METGAEHSQTNVPPSRRNDDRQSQVIGICLMTVGALSVIFNIVDLCLGTGLFFDQSSYIYGVTLSHMSNGVSGYGIICGVVFAVTGGFALGAAYEKTKCKIVAFLVLSIIGAVLACAQIIIAAVGGATVNSRNYLNVDVPISTFDCAGYSTYFVCRELKAVFTMAILLALCGVFAFVLCLWGSILCCLGHGCCATTPVASVAMKSQRESQLTLVTAAHQQQQPANPFVPPSHPSVYPAVQQQQNNNQPTVVE